MVLSLNITSHILEHWRVYLQYYVTLKIKEANITVIYRSFALKKKKKTQKESRTTHVPDENTNKA